MPIRMVEDNPGGGNKRKRPSNPGGGRRGGGSLITMLLPLLLKNPKLLKVKKISFFMDGYLDLVIFYLAYIGYQYL